MNSETYRQHKYENNLQTFLLILAMLGLLSVLGYSLGGIGWLIVFAVFGCITLCLTPRIGPILLLRFYKAKAIAPTDAPELYRIIEALSKRADLRYAPVVYYIPSKMHNAFAIGTGKTSVIGVTDALLRDFSAREMAGILAHEISHIKNNDTFVMGLADAISRFATFLSRLGLLLVLINIPLAIMGRYQIPWLGVALLILSPTLASLLQLGLSRTREFAADADAAHYTGDPEGLAMALAKLERIHANALERVFLPGRKVPEPSLLRTHPPTEERIERLQALRKDRKENDTEFEPVLASIGRVSELFSAFKERPKLKKVGWHFFGGTWY